MKRTKYTLIERPDYSKPTAVPTALLQDIRDSGEIITSERPITLKDIKREGVRLMTEDDWKFQMEQDARQKAYEAYRAKHQDVVVDAEVLSWDLLRGEGRVRMPDGSAREIYACNIPGRRTWYPGTACVFYMEGETVQVKLSIHWTKTFVIGVTPGYPDNKKWESLDHDRLAFRCNDDGTTTGLLPKGESLI